MGPSAQAAEAIKSMSSRSPEPDSQGPGWQDCRDSPSPSRNISPCDGKHRLQAFRPRTGGGGSRCSPRIGPLIEGKGCGQVRHIRVRVNPGGRETLLSGAPGGSFANPARRGGTGRPSQHRHFFSYAERARCYAEGDSCYADPADSYASKVELLSYFIADLLQSCVRSC